MKKYLFQDPVVDKAQSLKEYPERLQKLLIRRGVKTSEDAERFLNPNYDEHLHDPYLMKDMEKAVGRVLKAIDNNEKVVIYSDYDADGIPGGVVLHDFFKKIDYTNFENYIPHRHDEGYGVHLEAVENLAKEGAKLLITVDCGISDAKEVERANELGIDVIITDHHEPPEKFPRAFAVLNPKQSGDTYPFKMLCGSGVVFKFIQAILLRRDFGIKKGTEKWLLDLVGLATLSDMVPLTGENRVLARYGLFVLRKSPRVGLLKLLRKLKIDQRYITEDDIGFMISPRINAASRMGHPQDAFELLATQDEVRADILATHLDSINNERKGIVASLVKEMKRTLEKRIHSGSEKSVIVLGNPDWRPALLGLAACTISEEHNKPVFLWGRENGAHLKGSCRSEGKTNVVALMQTANKVFLEFGGHMMSGGFTILEEKVHLLETELIKAYEKLAEKGFSDNDTVYIDQRLSLADVNWQTWNLIEKLAPFGVGNPKPLFLLESVPVVEIRKFGKEKNHIELSLGNGTGPAIKAISFFSAEDDFVVRPEVGKKINLVATMEKSMFRNFPELRLRIVDII